MNRCRQAIDPASRAAASVDRSPNDEFALWFNQPILAFKPRQSARIGPKGCGELRFVAPGTDGRNVGAAAEDKFERINQDGFACPRLTGQNGEPRQHLQVERIDDDEIS